MMNPAPSTSWNLPASIGSARTAFAALDRTRRWLLEAVLFDGHACSELARSAGVEVAEVRARVAGAMAELREALTPQARDRGGAVERMIALHALDALDPDEAELVDVALMHQPALQRACTEDRELVGELCQMVPRIVPPPHILTRLCASLDGDTAAN